MRCRLAAGGQLAARQRHYRAAEFQHEKSSRSAETSKVLVEFDDRRGSTRLALVLDEQDCARKFIEDAAAAPMLFADDEEPFRIETDQELKRRKIDDATICFTIHF
jgi:hypothetical protein